MIAWVRYLLASAGALLTGLLCFDEDVCIDLGDCACCDE